MASYRTLYDEMHEMSPYDLLGLEYEDIRGRKIEMTEKG